MQYIHNFKDFPAVEDLPKVKRRAICGDQVMMTLIHYDSDTVVGSHYHEAEQIMYIVEGRLWLKIGDEEAEVGKGSVAVIPSNLPHELKAIEETIFIEAFHPIRLSYLIGYSGPSDATFVKSTD